MPPESLLFTLRGLFARATRPVSVVQPGCVRHFAQSLKVLAKTDAIDATVIATLDAVRPMAFERAITSGFR